MTGLHTSCRGHPKQEGREMSDIIVLKLFISMCTSKHWTQRRYRSLSAVSAVDMACCDFLK